MFTALAEVVAGALGGGKTDGKGPITEDLSNTTPEYFVQRVNQLLSF